LVDVYRALSYFATVKLEVQRHINEQIKACYGPRDTKTVYYEAYVKLKLENIEKYFSSIHKYFTPQGERNSQSAFAPSFDLT